MRGADARHRPDTGLTPSTNASLRAPDGYRGDFYVGDAATRLASLVSGPFDRVPLAYAAPADPASVERLLRWASERGLPIIPRGAGTGMPGGNLGPGVIVEITSGFEWIESTDDPAVLRLGAGTIALEADRAARARGRFVSFLPSSAQWCRVGGMVANNAAGARSFRYGAAADSVEAIEGFFASGEAFRWSAGEPSASASPIVDLEREIRGLVEASPGTGIPDWPRVRKNASGYAIDRFLASGRPETLLVGSEGTLAVITQVDIRVPRVPETTGLAVVAVDSSDGLTRVAESAVDIGTVACEFLGHRFLELAGLGKRPEMHPELAGIAPGAFALVLLEVEGNEDEVEQALRDVERMAEDLECPTILARERDRIDRFWSIRHAASPTIAREADRGRISTQFVEDCAVPPSRLGDYVDTIERILEEHRFEGVVFGHAGDANVHVNPLLDVDSDDWGLRAREVMEAVVELVADLGGTLTGEHGDGRIRTPYMDRIWAPHILEAFRIVKRRFDPEGRMNPGVIVPLPGQDPFEGFAPRVRTYPG